MQEEKYLDALKETDITIKEALGGNMLDHQRRLMSMISLGVQHSIELYFHKLRVIKPGAFVKHEWFRMGDKNARQKLSIILTKKIDEIPNIPEIISLAREIESDRNDIVYGAPLNDDKILRDKIDSFLELKKLAKGEENEQT